MRAYLRSKVTTRKDWYFYMWSIAQWSERLIVNQEVAGSSPVRPPKKSDVFTELGRLKMEGWTMVVKRS